MSHLGHVPKYSAENTEYTQAFNQVRVTREAQKLINPNVSNQSEARNVALPVNAPQLTVGRNPDNRKDVHPARKDSAQDDEGIPRKHRSNLPHQSRQRGHNTGSQPPPGKPISKAGSNSPLPAGSAVLNSPLSEKPGSGRSPVDRAFRPDVIVPPFPKSDVNPEDSEKYTGIFSLVAQNRAEPGGTTTSQTHMPSGREISDDTKGCKCISWLFK